MLKHAALPLPGAYAELSEAPIRVLHVDDELEYLRTTKLILEMDGDFQVESVSSAEEALEKLKEKKYDVIVSDYVMGGKDGLQFLKELREGGNRIPFIIFTGKGREIVAIRALNLGADFYVNKIGKPEAVYGELANAIRKLVNNKRVEELYRAIFEGTATPMAIDDENMKVIRVNPQFERLSGYSRQEIEGKKCTDFVTEESKKLVQKFHAERRRGGNAPAQYIVDVVTKNGDVRHCLLHVKLLPEFNWTIGSFIDVTEQKITEEELRKSETLYRTVFENSGTAMCIIEEDKTLSLVNQEFERLSGYSRNEVEGKKKWTEFIAKEYLELMQRRHEARRKPGERVPTSYSFDYINKQGQRRHALLRINLIPGTKKSIASIIDVTEQKKAEEALRESEASFRALFNGMQDTVWVIGFDGRFIDVNEAAVRVLGYSKEELLSMGPTEIDDNLTDEAIRNLIKNMPKDEIQVFETAHTTKDGKKIPVEICSSLVTYRGKQAILSIARDITERKRMEEELRKERELLEALTENVGAGLTIISRDYRVLWANQLLKELLWGMWKVNCVIEFTCRGTVCVRDVE